MRTLLAAIAAVAIVGCGRPAQQRPANPVVTPTVRVLAVRPTRLAVAEPSTVPATPPASPRPTAVPTAAPTAAPTVAPTRIAPTPTTLTATPVPASTPIQSPSPTASPSADPIPQLPPNAAPQIVTLHIDRTTVHGGDTVSGWIITSSNVASVEARIGYYSIPVPKTSIGHFALSYVVPYLPFFMHRTYEMSIIARNVAGAAVVRTIPINIR